MVTRRSARPTRRPVRRAHEWVLAAVPDELRRRIDAWADAWLKVKFTRGLQLRAADPGPFNYPVEVFSEWRGKSFYICARYRARSRRPEDGFVTRSARMTMTGVGRFELSFFRHTGRWFPIRHDLTVSECLKEIEDNEVFWPMT